MSIIEIVGDVCGRVSERMGMHINYVFGDSVYLNELLAIYSGSPKTSVLKFPLIALLAPLNENRDDLASLTMASVNLLIATSTLSEYTNEKRMDVSFKKVLIPIYKAFLDELMRDKRLDFGYKPEIRHTYRENYSYGKRNAIDDSGKALKDVIDGIDIGNLELKVKKIKCYGERI